MLRVLVVPLVEPIPFKFPAHSGVRDAAVLSVPVALLATKARNNSLVFNTVSVMSCGTLVPVPLNVLVYSTEFTAGIPANSKKAADIPPLVAEHESVTPVSPPALFGNAKMYVEMLAPGLEARTDQPPGVVTVGLDPVADTMSIKRFPATVAAQLHTRLVGEFALLALPPGDCTRVTAMLEAPH